jgi:glycosyltransferase involved in cell wall biosynthesis
LTTDSNTGEPAKMLWGQRGALAGADFLVSNTSYGLHVLRAGGIRLPPHKVIRNIVSSRGRAAPATPAEVPRIVASGTLNRRKAYDVLLRSLGRLSAEGAKFVLLLAGSGPERPSLEALARELGLAGCVELLGDVNDVPAVLATAHLFVHPSRSEGFSNSILEAMAEGLPVVASAVGGNQELVEDGRTGFLVPPGCPDRLGVAIRRLLDDAGLRGRLGRQGLAAVQETCSAARVASDYEDAIRDLISPPKTDGLP